MPTWLHDLLHAIVEKLPVHVNEKEVLHTQISDAAQTAETEVDGNGDAH